jgi:hypothetical protein
MSQRSALDGIAHDLVGTFTSRNNDIAGYWAIGKLYAHARRLQRAEVAIELLAGRITPPGDEFRSMLEKYASWLSTVLAAQGLPGTRVSGASINLTFDAAVKDVDILAPHARRRPYRCTVSLMDYRGGLHTADRTGDVEPHDPVGETKSSRE